MAIKHSCLLFKILHNTYTSCWFAKYKRVLNDIMYRQAEKNVGILLCLSFIRQWALFCISKNQPILLVVYTFALYFGCALSFLKFTFLSFRFDILIQYMQGRSHGGGMGGSGPPPPPTFVLEKFFNSFKTR